MSFMLEDLNPEEVKHLKVFDLNTWRGWFQLIGLFGFSGLTLGGFLLALSSVVVLQKSGVQNIDALLDLALGLYIMLPGWLMFNAIKGRHLGAKGLLFMSIFPPIGIYFALLRYMDGRLFAKTIKGHSRINDSFIVVSKS